MSLPIAGSLSILPSELMRTVTNCKVDYLFPDAFTALTALSDWCCQLKLAGRNADACWDWVMVVGAP